jgi:hypothetical protein
MKQLFLSHCSRHAEEIAALARELRFRGVRPWVDKQGGFLVADESAASADRAICEECLGFLLYATEDVFDRDFIREHEVPPALKMKQRDEAYLLFAVPRNLEFERLRQCSVQAFGADFSQFHTRPVNGDLSEVQFDLRTLASDVTTKVLRLSTVGINGSVRIQFSTRELAPVEDDDVLTIDGSEAYAQQNSSKLFEAFLLGLRDSKRALSARYGRPRLQVHGFKHLSAAFLFGRVFQPFDITVRQTPAEYWALDCEAGTQRVLDAETSILPAATELAVQISSRHKDLTPSVNEAMGGMPFNRLILRPCSAPLDVDEAIGAAMVRDCYRAIEREIASHPVIRIHVFAAAPQAVLMGLGKKFAGTPETLVYDYNGSTYDSPKLIPGGVL